MFEIVGSISKLLVGAIKAALSLKDVRHSLRKHQLAKSLTALYFSIGRIHENGRVIVRLLRDIHQSGQDSPRAFADLRYYLGIQEQEFLQLDTVALVHETSWSVGDHGKRGYESHKDYWKHTNWPTHIHVPLIEAIDLIAPELQQRLWFMLRFKHSLLRTLIRLDTAEAKDRINVLLGLQTEIASVDDVDVLLRDRSQITEWLCDNTYREGPVQSDTLCALNLSYLQCDWQDYKQRISKLDASLFQHQDRFLDVLQNVRSQYRTVLLDNFSLEELLW